MHLAAPGRFDKLQISFNVSVQCLLTACSREDVNEAFSSFTDAVKEPLHRMLTFVMKNLHSNIVDEFNNFCKETQVDATLDKIEDFVEEQSLDALYSEKTTVDEIQEKVEESNNAMKARVELKKGEDSTAARDVLNKVTQRNCALLNLFHDDPPALRASEQNNNNL